MLVVAKAPVPGRVKTRLGAEIGMPAAAALAAAALLDTLAACREAVGPGQCHLALDGSLTGAVHGDRIAAALEGWTVARQHGEGLGERLANAHAGVTGPRVQIGMDTPQVTPSLLLAVAGGLDDHDAVLGPAADGGWWTLALHDPVPARSLPGVPMSDARTYDATYAALTRGGLDVADCPALRDVDVQADAVAVAEAAPTTRFAVAWAEATGGQPPVSGS